MEKPEEDTQWKPLLSEDVREVLALLYGKLDRGELTLYDLQQYHQYIDTEILISCQLLDLDDVRSCNCDTGFEEGSSKPVDSVVQMIRDGCCPCLKESLAGGSTGDQVKVQIASRRLSHLAVTSDGNLELLEYLWKGGCDFSVKTKSRHQTLLSIAIQHNAIETVRFLVKHRIGITEYEAVDRDFEIYLHSALWLDREEIFKVLLTLKPSDLNEIIDMGPAKQTLLMKCVRTHKELVEPLLEAGADPNVAGVHSVTPLSFAVQSRDHSLAKLLIRYGADVNRYNLHQRPVIVVAIYRADVEMVRILLDAGANPNEAMPYDKNTLVILASFEGRLEIIKLLIKYGGHVRTRNKLGYTALHIAAWNGHAETVKILLEAGAQHDEQTSDKNTPLALAAHGNFLNVMKILLPLGCNVNNVDKDLDTPLHYATYNGMLEGVQLLLEYGSDPDMLNRINTTPLWNAVHQGHKDVVKALLVRNVKLEVSTIGINQHAHTEHVVHLYNVPRSPLWVAIDREFPGIALLLVTAGYNIYQERWLVCGEIPDNAIDARIVLLLRQYVHNPPRLIAICRNFFRRYFGLQLMSKMSDLDIPETLKNYVTLKDLALTKDADKTTR